jgi:hypothetical protein
MRRRRLFLRSHRECTDEKNERDNRGAFHGSRRSCAITSSSLDRMSHLPC